MTLSAFKRFVSADVNAGELRLVIEDALKKQTCTMGTMGSRLSWLSEAQNMNKPDSESHLTVVEMEQPWKFTARGWPITYWEPVTFEPVYPLHEIERMHPERIQSFRSPWVVLK